MSVMLDAERLPRHVAVIMDGNGRWARRRGLDRVAGHRRGAPGRIIYLACLGEEQPDEETLCRRRLRRVVRVGLDQPLRPDAG